MKTFYKTILILLVALFYQQALAATSTVSLLKTSVASGDTSQFQKPGRFKKHRKIKKEVDEQEDGVDDDIRARGQQEFLQQRDPKLNRVPLERLLTARTKRDQFLNDVKVRMKNARPQNKVVKPGGTSTVAAPSAPFTVSDLQWQERGPNNVGGRTRALMFDMGDAANGYKRVIAGGVGGGLWITSDITATPVQWTKVNDFFDNIAISCIAQNPVNPQEIYAGTGEGFLNADAIQGLGVWKSSDGGATWAQLPSTTGFKYINAILVDGNSNVYIAGETDIFVGFGVDQSTDGGTSWTNVINSSEPGADLQMAANGDVYASTGVFFLTGHIYISDHAVNGVHTGNAGTWTNITPATNGVITPATTSWYRIKLATAPSDANIVYAFFQNTSNAGTLGSVQQYNRSANTWTVKTVPAEAFSNGQAWYSIAAGVDPNNPSVLYAGSLDAEKSTDGGSTWTQYTHWNANPSASNYVHADHHAYVYVPGSSTRLLMGTDGGVFYTVNADVTPSFANKNNGYDVTQFYSAALHPTDFNYALAGSQDNGSQKFSSAGVGPTSVATGGDGADVFIDQTNGSIQVTSYVYDQYYVSTDNGATFHGLGSYGNGQFINPTAYDPSTKSLYAGSASGYYYRAENILSPAYNEVHVSNFSGANITSVAVAPMTANRVYFGLDNGSMVMVDNAQTGTSLTGVVLAPTVGSRINVSCINVDPASEDHILVTYSNYGVTHIIETKNASAATPTWTNVSGNLPDMPVRWSLFYPGDPTKAIIATELGVWTTDLINGSSTTWDPSNTGLANVEVDMLTYRAADRTLAAATHGRGLFTTILPTISASNPLTGLSLSAGSLSPAFAPATTSYTAAVSNATTSIQITPTTNDPASTVSIAGTIVASGSASPAIPLNVGGNNISIVATASDGNTMYNYTVAVTRAASTDASLAGLSLSAGILSPVFASATTSYTTSVNAPSIMATPTASDAGATIKVNGTAVASGTASAAIPLAVGSNTITTVVTAQDGTTTDTYTVTVTRISNNANLANLKVNSGNVAITPAFNFNTTSYTASVPNATTVVKITPVAADAANATIKVNGQPVASGAQSAGIALAIGSNTITTVVTAQDGVTTKTYTIVVTRVSTDASLAGLSLSAGTLSPAFASATMSYTTTVNTASVAVTPTANNAGATIKVNGTAVTSGTASAAIPLALGSNTITTVVTAQDGTTTDTYTVTVTRISNNANLANLKVNSGNVAISPAFNFNTTSYTASVPNATTVVKITPVAADAANATIKVNGQPVASGAQSAGIALAIGSNTITTVVTAQDGVTTKTYTIVITRVSTDASLAGLKLSAGTLSPAFASATMSYTTTVNTASIMVTPTANNAGATIKVNGTAVTSGTASAAIPLALGPNTITTVVTAQDGTTTDTYTVTVTRVSNNANLANLKVNSGNVAITPAFNFNTTSYTASVPNATTVVKITPVAADAANATIKVNGQPVASGAQSAGIALAIGSNTITTVVTAQDGVTTKTYTIVVTRVSTDASLAGLSLSAGTLSPAFASATMSYTTTVNTASVTVTPTANNAGATIKVNGTAVTSGTASAAIPLALGPNTITTVVTAQDGTTTDTYTITVTRVSNNANLTNLKVNSGNVAISPTFNFNTTSYTASVPNATTVVKITPVAADANATIKVNGQPVTSGTQSPGVALAVGSNTITTVVTAQDGVTTKTYTVTVTRAGGTVANLAQTGSIAKTIQAPKLDADGITVHQAVSPNGDGQNEFLIIEGIANHPENRLLIMNRSGALIFEAKGYNNNTRVFDGHSNKTGVKQLPGTYFYSLEYKVKGAVKRKTGFIILKY